MPAAAPRGTTYTACRPWLVEHLEVDMTLLNHLPLHHIQVHLRSSTAEGAVGELAALLAVRTGVAESSLAAGLLAREHLVSTGVGDGVAIPHCRVAGLDTAVMAVGLSPSGIPFKAIDGKPVHIFVAVATGTARTAEHLKILARLSYLLRAPDVRSRLLAARAPEEVAAVIEFAERRHDFAQ